MIIILDLIFWCFDFFVLLYWERMFHGYRIIWEEYIDNVDDKIIKEDLACSRTATEVQ